MSATPATPWTPAILDALDGLLTGRDALDDDGGAALTITGPDGRTVYQQPLARMARVDNDDPAVLWIRPITGRNADTAVPPTFSLSAARRRSLAATTARLDARTGAITAQLRTGQHATITAATDPAHAAALRDWDTFLSTSLTAADEAALEALDEDSWHGPHA